MHGCGIAIILIGHIEGLAVRTWRTYKCHVSRCTKGPPAVCHREDGQRANARERAHGQAEAFRVHNPIRGIAPIERQIIAQLVPLFPGPPHAVAARGRKRSWAERERIAIRAKRRACAARIDRRHCMIRRFRVYYRVKSDPDHGQEEENRQQMKKALARPERLYSSRWAWPYIFQWSPQ